jgi:hypothetical protein
VHIVKARLEDSPASREGLPPREIASSSSERPVENRQPLGMVPPPSLSECECPTRKVLNPLLAHLNQPNESSAGLPKTGGDPSESPGRRKGQLLVAMAMAFTAATGIGIWQAVRAPKTLPPSMRSAATNRPTAPPIESDPLRVTPALIHVEIGVQPAVATLELDDKSAGGNQLRFDTPRDGQVHSIHASAPGFVPFYKVVSFSTDVYLSIELQRVLEPKPGVSRGREPRAETKPRLNSRGRPVSALTDDFELRRPSPRRPSSAIDDKDPYEP